MKKNSLWIFSWGIALFLHFHAQLVWAQGGRLAGDRWSWRSVLSHSKLVMDRGSLNEEFLKKNRKLIKPDLELFLSSVSVLRGEFVAPDLQSTQDYFWELTQLLLKDPKYWGLVGLQPDQPQLIRAWSRYFSEVVFEDSNFKTLLLVAKKRLSLWQTLRQGAPKDPQQLQGWGRAVRDLRSSWPVDRIVFLESRGLQQQNLRKLFERAAQELQKNPYESLSSIFKRKKWAEPKSGREKELLQIWGEEQIQQMKLEVTELQRLQLFYAQQSFRARTGRIPSSIQELLQAGDLKSTPLDYTTGQPLSL